MRRGGLKGEIYVANLGEITDISSTTNDKNMDTITMAIDPLTTLPYFWYRIQFKKNTAGLNNEVQFGNNIFVNQSVTFTIEGITADSLAVLEQMVDGEAVFIAKDYEGVAHVLGRIGGLTASAMTVGTGTVADDLYGGVITFSSEEPELSNIVVAGTTIEVLDSTGLATETITL
jgi:hypothetical protein